MRVEFVSGLAFATGGEQGPLVEAMLRHRHHIFVGLLGWRALERPDGRDVDAYDHADAVHVVVCDEAGKFRGSARLLPTAGPHMLADHFSHLVDEAVPRGPDILEWSRHAPGRPDWSAEVNEAARLALHRGVLRYCLDHGITALTAVMDRGLLRRARSYGWDCTVLGPPHPYGEGEAVAVLNPVRAAHLTQLEARAAAFEAAA